MSKKKKKKNKSRVQRAARPVPRKARPRPRVARSGASAALAAHRRVLARNKRLVVAFYEAAIVRKDFAAARRYMADSYLQHNPTAATGPDGLEQWLADFKLAFPEHRAEIKRVIAEGDLVVLHVYGANGLGPKGDAVVDIFRVENGKVAEHWDVIQPIPAEASNPNSMF